MQVIDNDAFLDAISGGGGSKGNDNEISCTISNKEIGCSGPAEKWGEVAFRAFDEIQRWGGALGRWAYDVTH